MRSLLLCAALVAAPLWAADRPPNVVIILSDENFINGTHSTNWVEESLDFSSIVSPPLAISSGEDALVRKDVTAEVNGRRVAVAVWLPEVEDVSTRPVAGAKPRRAHHSSVSTTGSGNVVAPMQGTIVKVSVEVGQSVEVGDTIVILEAMKMENSVRAERSGTVSAIAVSAGDGVSAGDVVAEIK